MEREELKGIAEVDQAAEQPELGPTEHQLAAAAFEDGVSADHRDDDAFDADFVSSERLIV